MKVLVNKLHFPVEVLGPGRRVGIWMQGCTIRCFGCISRDTWAADSRFAVEVDEVLEWIACLPAGGVDGVTISGGEPFDQPEALGRLLDGLHDWRAAQGVEIDFLAYSGRAEGELRRDFGDMLGKLDAVVAEPFIQGEHTTLPLRGSANQEVVALSELGMERYTGDALDSLAAQRQRVQLEVDDESVWMIGIPQQGAMRRVQRRAADAGTAMRRPSWLV